MDQSSLVVELRDIRKSYPLGETEVQALRGVTLGLKHGEFIAVVGASGSGKSTLLNIIGGIDRPDAGQVLVNGQSWADLSDNRRSELRNQFFGFVFQSFNLMPMLSVFENVELPLMIQKNLSQTERKKRVEALLADVGLTDFTRQKPDKLSGGQRQRVAIARSLVTDPHVVIADEPTANLDSVTTMQVVKLMLDLNAKKNVTFIFSTHDERLMSQVKRIIRLKDGVLQTYS
jgi:putative ABC transport system ATP-binding protein